MAAGEDPVAVRPFLFLGAEVGWWGWLAGCFGRRAGLFGWVTECFAWVTGLVARRAELGAR